MSITTPADVRQAQDAATVAQAEVVALDSAARAAELTRGDEFASALRQCKRLIWTAAIFSGGVNILFLASPLYLVEVYNRVIPSGSIPTLVSLSIGLLIALSTMVVFDAVRARLLIRAAARLDRVLAHRVFEAIIDLAPRTGANARNAQMLRDLDQFRTALAGQGAQFFFDVPWMPLFLIVLFIIHPLLGGVALGGAVLLLVLAWVNNRATRESARVAQEAAGRSYQFTDSIARHAGPVRAMGMEDALAVHWHIDRATMMRRQAEGSDKNADMASVFKFVRLILQSAMIGIGGYLVIQNQLLAASIFAANLLLGRALAPLELAVTGWRTIAQAVVAGRNVQKMLKLAPPPDLKVDVPDDHVGIEVQGASYTPPGAKKPALSDIDVTIRPGEAIGIVGPSGAGKSCLARMLVAITSPQQGRVVIGGVEGRHWTSESLSRLVGYLPQTVGLFPGTIRENIARFTQASDEDVITAARRANVHDMIMAFPDGYDTRVSEGGAGLSGGQRQRIGLARAMFGSPRLLVLDEPNAHLDQDGEEALAAALKTLKSEGCTIILVAHRLNPIAHVDRVLVLSNGELQLDGPRARVFRKVRTELVRSIAREPVGA
ncbi:type I secretion system permease/ATPase [Sphingomonas hankookensis]|uniref:type I secretion system permease/ATPase n=1 Tax=Sphingomonas hankookensis TaxID=563996 RepID=UPI001F55FFF8|nr:type I secretion system permease/ATPase [Sphingomonas hankookensis]